MLNDLNSLQSSSEPTGPAKGRPRIRVHLPHKPHAHGANHHHGTKHAAPAAKHAAPAAKHTFTKIFRWRVPKGHAPRPATVEIVGSFTGWQRVPLARDTEADVWQVALHQIPLNRTHHYMLLADGKPVADSHADGMVAPHGPHEHQYQLMTSRGGRVFMLYAQTK